MEPVQLAAILVGAALLASMVSVQIGVSVALIELAFGIGLGNVFNLNPDQSWLVLIAELRFGGAHVPRGRGGRPRRFPGAFPRRRSRSGWRRSQARSWSRRWSRSGRWDGRRRRR